MTQNLQVSLKPLSSVTFSDDFYKIIYGSVPSAHVSAASPSLSSIISSLNSSVSSAKSHGTPFFQSVCISLSRLRSSIYFFFHSRFYSTINPYVSQEKLKEIYCGLGSEKWKECIDGKYHHLGKNVFALGLHKGVIEPEYVPSMEAAHEFCAKYLNKKVDADWYLQLHQIACRHFDGDPEVVLMGQEKVGVFRDSDDYVCWWPSGNYAITSEAKTELEALNEEVSRELGSEYRMGCFAIDPSFKAMKHSYHAMSRAQVKKVFNKFMSDFYSEVERALNQDQKLLAIAKLNKRLELLHPVKDGSGRTNTALINKILTEYGFHPAILDQPYVSTSYGLQRWKSYLSQGLQKWERVRAQLRP